LVKKIISLYTKGDPCCAKDSKRIIVSFVHYTGKRTVLGGYEWDRALKGEFSEEEFRRILRPYLRLEEKGVDSPSFA